MSCNSTHITTQEYCDSECKVCREVTYKPVNQCRNFFDQESYINLCHKEKPKIPEFAFVLTKQTNRTGCRGEDIDELYYQFPTCYPFGESGTPSKQYCDKRDGKVYYKAYSNVNCSGDARSVLEFSNGICHPWYNQRIIGCEKEH